MKLNQNENIMISREFKIGDKITAAEMGEIQIVPVNKTVPMPDGTTIKRVNLIDLGREGYRAIHFGGDSGPMYKDRGSNEFTTEATVVAIFRPKN